MFHDMMSDTSNLTFFKDFFKKCAVNGAIKKCYQNRLGQLLQQFSKLYQLWGLSRDHYWRGGIQEIHDFQGFWSIPQRVIDISS